MALTVDLLKKIILDYQELKIETGVPRRLDVAPVAGKATICIGVRRCGKSTFMYQLMDRLLKKGIPRQNILHLNFFDDRLHDLRNGGIGTILDAYFSLYPAKKNEEKVYCFFDEIQAVPGWEAFVDRIMRTEKCEVYITGSSAQLLSKEIASQMRGRSLSWEIFPFSFREFLDFHGVESGSHLSTKKQLIVQKAFEEYSDKGGFPEVAGVERQMRIKMHQEYFNAMLFRDLIDRHNISHPRALLDLAYWLVDNTSSLYSINRLTGYLKSLGHNAPKSVVSDYLNWLEDAYCNFAVLIFDASLSKANANPKKIYCIDHSFATSIGSGVLVNSGHLLENLVYTALRRTTPDIAYFKTKGGREVDFIVRLPDRRRMLVQVCESILDRQTRSREISALSEAMSELKLKTGTIVTRSEAELVEVGAGKITIAPAWRFLLDLDSI
jgi:predicted AAA+ superfamily ATPase